MSKKKPIPQAQLVSWFITKTQRYTVNTSHKTLSLSTPKLKQCLESNRKCFGSLNRQSWNKSRVICKSKWFRNTQGHLNKAKCSLTAPSPSPTPCGRPETRESHCLFLHEGDQPPVGPRLGGLPGHTELSVLKLGRWKEDRDVLVAPDEPSVLPGKCSLPTADPKAREDQP